MFNVYAVPVPVAVHVSSDAIFVCALEVPASKAEHAKIPSTMVIGRFMSSPPP
jgi:hypothetical protein